MKNHHKAAVAGMAAAFILACAPAFAQQSLQPRAPGAKQTLARMLAMPVSSQVVVKFRESSGMRLRGGRLVGANAVDSNSVADLLQRERVAGNAVQRLHTRAESDLEAEREQAQRVSGRALADLNLYYVITVPPGSSPAVLADRLNSLAVVEFAEPAPQPTPLPLDIAPATPKLVANQGYREPGPKGVGALDPDDVPGGGGKDIAFVDVEYSWQINHEDIELTPAINVDKEATGSDPFSDTNHGTAVLGELVGKKNKYGVTGIVPGASPHVAPANTQEFGYNPARAISIATGAIKAGRVIILEQQMPVCGGQCGGSQVGCGPLEGLQSAFDAISIATAKGIIVVEAAGNGNVNLDGPTCNGMFDRKVRDSHAIIVGAGSATNHSRLSFSSFGKRVDVQGWGEQVTTTGYGDAFNPGDVRQRYTNQFGGTSSASPIVTGAVVAIQGALKAKGRKLAKPEEMRKALIKTGTAQSNASTGHIGPLPRIKKALDKIVSDRAGDAGDSDDDAGF